MSEYTPERLQEWARECARGDRLLWLPELLQFANAWEAERKDCHGYAMAASYEADRADELTAEVRKLRALLDEFDRYQVGNMEYLRSPFAARVKAYLSSQPEPQERGEDWIVHTGHSRPELGDMEAVDMQPLHDDSRVTNKPIAAKKVPWETHQLRYCRVYHNGYPAVVNDGSLEKWARWISVRADRVLQHSLKPDYVLGGFCPVDEGLWQQAPDRYAIPGPSRDSLRSVLPEGE